MLSHFMRVTRFERQSKSGALHLSFALLRQHYTAACRRQGAARLGPSYRSSSALQEMPKPDALLSKMKAPRKLRSRERYAKPAKFRDLREQLRRPWVFRAQSLGGHFLHPRSASHVQLLSRTRSFVWFGSPRSFSGHKLRFHERYNHRLETEWLSRSNRALWDLFGKAAEHIAVTTSAPR
jgi:hypothetical protein